MCVPSTVRGRRRCIQTGGFFAADSKNRNKPFRQRMKRSESFQDSDKGSKIGIKASWVRSGKEEVASFQLDLAEADLTIRKRHEDRLPNRR